MNTTPQRKTPGQIAFEAALETRPDCKEFGFTWESSANRASWEAAALAVLASQWRPVKEPPETDRKVLLMTKSNDDCFASLFSNAGSTRTHWAEIPPFVEPVDPHADLKAAHAAGKVIQCHQRTRDLWKDLPNPNWTAPPDYYRIKPWNLTRHLPPFRLLEDGEEWHRSDFTEDMLPEGWRPLLSGEKVQDGDERKFAHASWDSWPSNSAQYINAGKNNCHIRTRRPLPPTKAEKERKEFDTWWNENQHRHTFRADACFEAWQAARKQPTPPTP